MNKLGKALAIWKKAWGKSVERFSNVSGIGDRLFPGLGKDRTIDDIIEIRRRLRLTASMRLWNHVRK